MNSKRFLCSLAALPLLIGSACANTLPEISKDQKTETWTITGKNYKAAIGAKGYISSIKSDGKEFLSQSKKLSCGTYLCGGNIPYLLDLKKTDDNTITGNNKLAVISYKFEAKKILLTILDIKEKCSFYIIINKAVKKVNHVMGAKEVPTIASVPATATCDNTRWFQKNISLDIIGGNRIWGPWRGFQVWEAKLSPGKKRTIEFRLGKEAPPQSKLDAIHKKAPAEKFTYTKTTEPQQIPLCMIGDSITWAGKGDYWRKDLLEIIPRLAFVGTHTAQLGYSHAGEGGNSTSKVLKRIDDIPACPYYSLLIGTNDTGVKKESLSKKRSEDTAERIEQIVLELLKKPGVKKVFLCSILPCHTKNPLRDKTNSLTNIILREKMKTAFPKEKVAWIEFEKPIRAMKNWEPKIKLHPTLEGYKAIAKIHTDALIKELEIKNPSAAPVPMQETGVRINNLWDKKEAQTKAPIIAGWYTVSFQLKNEAGKNPSVTISSSDQSLKAPFNKTFKLKASNAGKRVELNFFTNYEGYGYSRSIMKIIPNECEIDKILFEKTRPSKKASTYAEGIYIDTTTKPAPGELVEKKQ